MTQNGGAVMKVGYARCSTIDQNPARQEAILKDFGCEKIYLDMLSGKNTNRPRLQEMISYVREGDIVFVESISRLARNTRDLLNIIEKLQEKKVQLVSQKESIDTSSAQGKFMLTVFGAMAELERDYIKERQEEGIAIAKKNGKYKGRQPKSYDHKYFEQLYKEWRDGYITQQYMCKRLGLSRSTLYREIKKYEKNNKLVK